MAVSISELEARLLTALDNLGVLAEFTHVAEELVSATEVNGPMRSAHEGWAVLFEEVDELWEEVKKRERDRSVTKMRLEAKQSAAMAIRFMKDVCKRG